MLARSAVLVVLLVVALAPPARAQDVAQGPLRASLSAGGALAIRQAGGADLRQLPGSLRLRTATGWDAATRVVGRRRVGSTQELTLATRAGRRARLGVAPASGAGGGVRVTARFAAGPPAQAVAMAFRADPGERFYGFGERSHGVALHATTVESYVSDGPFSPDSIPLVRATIPPAGFRDRPDATYYPVPWLLSGRGYGVLVDQDETSTFRLPSARGGSWEAQAQAPRLQLRVFAGPTPAGALRRFTAATGRQPAPPAAWAFGPWLQTGQPNAPPLAEQQSDLAKLKAADAPVSAAETQLRYLPCGLDRGLEDYEARRTRFYHEQGLAVLTYVNPMLCASYEPRFSRARDAGALLHRAADHSAPALFNSFVGGIGAAGFSIQSVGEYDFTRAAGRAAYGDVVSRLQATGHDGWMEDFGEYTPLDARAGDGATGTALHNRYPVDYHCAVHRMTAGRPVVRFQRSGWTGAARCATLVWGGDPTTEFGFDGLSSAVKQALSIGLSGVSRWGSDIGGYDTIAKDPKLTPELLKRWVEFGAVSGVMRIKKSGLAIPNYQRPQVWDPDVIGVWRRYTKLHTQLHPYLQAADARYRRTGLPLMRAHVLDDPGDARGARREDQFVFGDDLLAAPVVRAGARSRPVYLPRGRWLDARAALRYDRRGDGAFHAGAAPALRGGRTVRARAALDELPLYVRAGAVLPMLPADVFTLSRYGRGRAVRLADRAGALRLLAFPGPTRGAALSGTRGDRVRSSTRPGTWTLRIAGGRTRRYTLEASLRGLRAGDGGRFRACSVSVGGRALRRGAWREAGGVLRTAFGARQTTVVVRAC